MFAQFLQIRLMQMTPFPWFELADIERPDADPDESGDFVIEQLKHAANLPI